MAKDRGEKMTIQKAREEIGEQVALHGRFSHNIISIVLRQVAKDLGQGTANELIANYKLEKKFGIGKTKVN